MNKIENCYSVYLHVFPDGKKYVGYTGRPLRLRWDGGLGYINHNRMFGVILNVGWENIRHYVLFTNLDKETAKLTEAALIQAWKTYLPSRGYNVRAPEPDGYKTFDVPAFKKRQINDSYKNTVAERLSIRKSSKCNTHDWRRKPVKLVETGEVFDSIVDAANAIGVKSNSLYAAVNNPNRTCGTCWIEDSDEGWRMEVRAHWEYVNKEEKEG